MAAACRRYAISYEHAPPPPLHLPSSLLFHTCRYAISYEHGAMVAPLVKAGRARFCAWLRAHRASEVDADRRMAVYSHLLT